MLQALPWAPVLLGSERDCFPQAALVKGKEDKWQEAWESSSGGIASVLSYAPLPALGSSNQGAQILGVTGSHLPISCQKGQGVHQHGLQKGHRKTAGCMHLTTPRLLYLFWAFYLPILRALPAPTSSTNKIAIDLIHTSHCYPRGPKQK